MKTMIALSVLRGTKARCAKITYNEKSWSGIRISASKQGNPTELQLSRVTGSVGDLRAETLEIPCEVEVEVDEP